MKKKLLSLGVLLVMIFSVFPLASCGDNWKDYEYKEGDFVLELTVDKTTASIGDTIEITAELKNLSGRSLPICYPNDSKRGLVGPIHFFNIIDVYPQKWAKTTFKNGASIEKTVSRTIDNIELIQAIGNFPIVAMARFYIGKNDSGKIIGVTSELIEINII